MRSKLGNFKKHINERQKVNADRAKYELYANRQFLSVADLGHSHFETWSDPQHVNRPGFECALERMAGKPKTILETGTSAWGTDSTRLWDAYVRCFGGEFWSVDLSPMPRERLKNQVGPRSHLEVGDSVEFIENFSTNHNISSIDVCYLDSWDLDWSDPDPAAEHGLNEWHAVAPLMAPGSLLIIDDSPASLQWVPDQYLALAQEYERVRGYLPGKGALVDRLLRLDNRVQVLWHGYNSVYYFSDMIT